MLINRSRLQTLLVMAINKHFEWFLFVTLQAKPVQYQTRSPSADSSVAGHLRRGKHLRPALVSLRQPVRSADGMRWWAPLALRRC